MNVLPSTAETRLSFVAPGEKPRLIHVPSSPPAKFPLSSVKASEKPLTLCCMLNSGITGVVAPIIGKQPPDYHIWILPGVSPAFIREEGPLYEGGPISRIEQISPEFLH